MTHAEQRNNTNREKDRLRQLQKPCHRLTNLRRSRTLRAHLHRRRKTHQKKVKTARKKKTQTSQRRTKACQKTTKRRQRIAKPLQDMMKYTKQRSNKE